MQTQCDKILEVLDDGGYHSTKELIERTKITYPPRRIYDLKKMGFKILSEPIKVDGVRWEAYKLVRGQMNLL